MVKYSKIINWRTDFPEDFFVFKSKMDSDQWFKYFVKNGMPHHELLKREYASFIYTENKFNFYKALYNVHHEQYSCMNELMEIRNLGKLCAPELHQIRIDKLNDEGGIKKYGIPFRPNEMESKFKEIEAGYVAISYLIERCEESVVAYVKTHPEAEEIVGNKVVEFVDLFVDTQNKLNCDFKPPNICLKMEGDGTTVRLLDVDPDYNIKGETPEFKDNSKVFMKLLFFGYLKKQENIKFADWHVTREEVEAMIRFFYTDEYLIYEKNPINVLYYYLVSEHPGKFLNQTGERYVNSHFSYNALKMYFETSDEMVDFFMKIIEGGEEVILPSGGGRLDVKEGGGRPDSESLGGSKRKRKSKKRKNKKGKYTIRSTKN